MTLRLPLATWMLCVGTLLAAFSCNTVQAQPRKEHIYASGSAAFQASHASTVVELRQGELMSAWFAGTAKGNPDVAMWGSTKNSREYSNPALIQTAKGDLEMTYTGSRRMIEHVRLPLADVPKQ